MDLRELTWKDRGRLWGRLGIRLILAVVVLLLLFFALPPLISLFMPFVLAVLMAWLLNPLIRWVQRRMKISRQILSFLLIVLSFAVVGGLLFWLFYSVGSEVVSLVANWDSVGAALSEMLETVAVYSDRLVALLPDELEQWLDGTYAELIAWLQNVAPELLAGLGKGAGNIAMQVPSWGIAFAVFVVAAYFFTADYPRIRAMVTERMSTGVRDFLSRVKKVAVAAFGGYVRAQLILSLVVFVILLLGFSITGQSYAFLLAFILAVMDFIPIIGSGTAIVPWTIISVLMGNYRKAIELAVIWGIIAVFRRLAEPKVVGDQTGLSPILSLVSIYVGMRLAGVLGMIFGPVILLIIINVMKMGVFAGTRRDLRMVVDDVRAILAVSRRNS